MPKDDSGKIRLDLITPEFLSDLGEVLTQGAIRYGENNWKTLDNSKQRYRNALFRHFNAYRSGELIDQDSGMSHIIHVAANAMFLHWLE